MEYLNLNLDKNLTLNSDTTISSQKALKSYIDAKRINLDFLQADAPSEFSIGDKWLNTTDKKVYTAISSSTWDSGVSLTDGQICSFENLLYHYDGTNILIYSTETITEQNNRNEIKSWFGTQNEYDALSEIDDNTTYYIVDNASVVSTLLATQQEFNNSVQDKAATPYQVNQALGNYLPLAGGNLDANAVLRLTNSNNGTVTLAYNTSNYLTVSSNLSVNGTTSTNSLIATSGNIYNGSISGATALWSSAKGAANGLATLDSNTKIPYTQLPIATSSVVGAVKPDGTTITVDSNGVITAISDISGAVTSVVAGSTADKINVTKNNSTSTITINNVANATKASQDGNGNVIISTYVKNTDFATSSAAGIVKPDGTTTSVDVNGVISVIGGGSGGGSVILLQFLQSTTPTTYSTDDKWLNTSDYKLYTATSSSAWDNGTTITEDQIFGFNNLLYHYNGTSLEIYSTESIKEQNAGNETKLWVGTQDEYDSISTYDVNTIYNIVDSETSLANQYHPPLLSFMWSDHQINQVSWLRADTFSWQSGSVYEAVYNHLTGEVTFSSPGKVYNSSLNMFVQSFSGTRMPKGTVAYRNSAYDYVDGATTYYAWAYGDTLNSNGVLYDGIFFTTETPSAGDASYIAKQNNNLTYMGFDGDIQVNDQIYCDISSNSQGIIYYLATDGHKVVPASEVDVVNNLYNTTGVAWYFILDTENERFKLPRTKYSFTGLRDSVGNYVPESLPKPSMVVRYDNQGSPQPYDSTYGADGYSVMSSSDANERMLLEKDVSNSMKGTDILTDSTYQDSAPVQQRATQMYLYFYVGNYTETAIEQTAGLNAELFNSKVDLDAANLSNVGKSLIAGLGMPSSTRIDLTPAASGDTYTAAYSGYMCFDFSTVNAGAWISVYVNGQGFVNLQQERTSYGGCVFVPCGKNDVIMCVYPVEITLNNVYLMKAKGEI